MVESIPQIAQIAGQISHKSPDFDRICANRGQTPAGLGRNRSTLANSGPTLGPLRSRSAKFGRIWPEIGQVRPESGQFGRNPADLAESGQSMFKPGPPLAELSPARFGRSRSELVDVGPSLAQMLAVSDRLRLKPLRSGQTRAKVDRNRSNVGRIAPTSVEFRQRWPNAGQLLVKTQAGSRRNRARDGHKIKISSNVTGLIWAKFGELLAASTEVGNIQSFKRAGRRSGARRLHGGCLMSCVGTIASGNPTACGDPTDCGDPMGFGDFTIPWAVDLPWPAASIPTPFNKKTSASSMLGGSTEIIHGPR